MGGFNRLFLLYNIAKRNLFNTTFFRITIYTIALTLPIMGMV